MEPNDIEMAFEQSRPLEITESIHDIVDKILQREWSMTQRLFFCFFREFSQQKTDMSDMTYDSWCLLGGFNPFEKS